MKIIMALLFLVLYSYNPGQGSCADPADIGSANSESSLNNNEDKYSDFKLTFLYAGLGSNFGTMQPVLRVEKNKYTYTREQNSFYTKPDKEPELIATGEFRSSSIDSIISIVKDLTDTAVYKTSTGILSGGIHSLLIHYNNRKISFELHNAFDTTVQQIVDILNSNLPSGAEKLWLFKFHES